MATTKQNSQTQSFITIQQLKDKINEFDGQQAKFANIVYISNARILKKDRVTGDPSPVQNAYWYQQVNLILNVNYENSVNRQLDKEGKEQLHFTKKDRSWGEQVNDGENGCLVFYNGFYYIQGRPNSVTDQRLLDEDNNDITYLKDSWDIFPKKSKPKNQGVDNTIPVRAYRLDRIQAISLNNEKFQVISI